MKYYSEALKRIFDTPEELEQAEAKINNRKNEVEGIKKEINDVLETFTNSLKTLMHLSDKAENICTEEELDEIAENMLTTLTRAVTTLYSFF